VTTKASALEIPGWDERLPDTDFVIASILIGNGYSEDSELSLRRWVTYCKTMASAVTKHSRVTIFKGGASTDSFDQNYCWVVEITKTRLPSFEKDVAECRRMFHQNYIEVIYGDRTYL